MIHRPLTGLRLAVWSTLMILSASAVHAQSYEECKAVAKGVVSDLKVCDGAELDRRKAMLDQVYQQLQHAIDPERQEKLREAERAWTAFAEVESAFCMSAEAGGMDAPLLYNRCRLNLISRRIEDLQKAIEVAKF